MVRLAVEGIPGLEVSEVEFAREGPSYSVDTVAALAAANPGCELHFLLGEDNLDEIWTWKEPERLFHLCRVVVLGRWGASRDPGGRDLPGPVTMLARRRIDLSSSEVRERVRKGLPIRCLVPPRVERYIKDHSLYHRDPPGRARPGGAPGGDR
jgi:nicotinate-nucleotide adenylyltransferase